MGFWARFHLGFKIEFAYRDIGFLGKCHIGVLVHIGVYGILPAFLVLHGGIWFIAHLQDEEVEH